MSLPGYLVGVGVESVGFGHGADRLLLSLLILVGSVTNNGRADESPEGG